MKRIILIVFCTIVLIKTLLCLAFYKNTNYEIKKSVKGIITYIKYDDNKTTLDIKSDKKCRITLYSKVSYKLGDKIKVEGIFKNASDNTVFNLFNYNKYLLSKKIAMISINPKVTLIEKNTNLFYTLKNNMISHVNKYNTNGYLTAFLLGDKSYIDDDVKNDYKMLGISHLFAVSGMHVALLLLTLNFILKKVKYKDIIIILFLLLFLFLTNYTESLLRCFLFILIGYICKIFKIKLSSESKLLITLLILLLYNSFYIYNVGFIFSFVITYFILISKDKLKGNYVIKTLKSSFICFLSSIPILACNFFTINLLTPIYNLFFIPFVSFIIFPLSIITFLIKPLDNIYMFIINLFEKCVSILSNIKMFTFTIGKPCIMLIILYYLFLYLMIKKNKKFVFLYIALLIININMKYFIINPIITFIDVGQGDSSLIISSKGKSVLIDTGGVPFSNYSISENKIIPYLNSYGINSIDTLILTHGDYDHMGEAINLVNNFKVEKVIFNCGEFNDLEKELIKVLDKKKIKYYSCIDELNIDKNKLYFLQTKEYDNENDNSNVIYTELNDYKFMFMGDASTTTEKEILNTYNLPDIDVLKVGHHGSKTSSSEEFINKIKPKYSIISVGKNNRYGHPNKEALDNLKDSKIYRTDQDGSIMFEIKNNKLKIERCSP